jgi:hypothetical protein
MYSFLRKRCHKFRDTLDFDQNRGFFVASSKNISLESIIY